MWSRNGSDPVRAVAIFPDRLGQMESAVKWGIEDGRLAGYNKAGNRTCLFVMDQALPGMILASPAGVRSTPIVEVGY